MKKYFNTSVFDNLYNRIFRKEKKDNVEEKIDSKDIILDTSNLEYPKPEESLEEDNPNLEESLEEDNPNLEEFLEEDNPNLEESLDEDNPNLEESLEEDNPNLEESLEDVPRILSLENPTNLESLETLESLEYLEDDSSYKWNEMKYDQRM
jgi:hypothetical protein